MRPRGEWQLLHALNPPYEPSTEGGHSGVRREWGSRERCPECHQHRVGGRRATIIELVVRAEGVREVCQDSISSSAMMGRAFLI